MAERMIVARSTAADRRAQQQRAVAAGVSSGVGMASGGRKIESRPCK